MARGERTRLGSALVLGLLIATAGPARAAPTADSLGAPFGAFPLPTDTSATVRPSHWTLVLSGGGARGLAHIGVLRVLEEEGLRPDLVVGTSMGALVGALWAGGATSDEIRARMDALDWEGVFDPRRLAPEWRRTVVARPWMRFVAGGRGLGLPSGIVDDSELNYRLSVDLLEADARAQGDFDRLPIPFRAVATDGADLKPVSLAHGSVARAVRASISIPAVFPPVAQDSTLLVDGGVASNLPIGIARRAGAERVLAVDVSFPERALSEDESVLTLSVTLLDRVNRRGQTGDTTRAGDARVWIPLPHVSPAAWNETPRLVEMGYRDSRDSIRAWARAAGIARAPSAARDSALVLPPIAGPVQWFDRNGRPSRREDDARAVFGRLPAGRFRPSELVPGIERVYRAGLFESDWPWLRVQGDSTRIGMQVKEFPAAELDGAFAYDNDTEARMNARAVWRNAGGYAPGEVTLGGTLRKYGAEGFGSVSPHPLDRGSSGWFARAVSRTTEVRIFGPEGLDGLERVERVEGTLGLQRVLPWSDIVQVGAGGAWTRGGGQEAGGVLLAMRGEGTGTWHRVLEGAWRPGHLGYGTATLDLDRTHPLGTDFALRGAVALGWSSEQAPLDEWRGVGGPGSMPGLRAGEWLGRRMASAELRLTRILVSTLRARASVAVAGVGDAVGRTDLGEHAHVGAGIGLAFGSALGPLSLDYGIMDRSRFRVDVRIGASF